MLFSSLYRDGRFSGLLVLAWIFSFILAGIFDVLSIGNMLHAVRGYVPGWWLWAGGILTILIIVLLPPKGTQFTAD